MEGNISCRFGDRDDGRPSSAFLADVGGEETRAAGRPRADTDGFNNDIVCVCVSGLNCVVHEAVLRFSTHKG